MRILTTSLIAVAATALAGSAVWAQDNTTQPAGGTPTSTTQAQHTLPDAFDSPLSLSPQVGSFGFEAGNQTYDSRIIEGITATLNLASLITPSPGWTLGLTAGVLYSHLGSPDANWFGANSSALSTEGANMYLIPVLLQVGYRPTDSSLVALNLGAQLLDRSMGNSMFLGRPGDSTTGSSFDVFPSVGLSLGWEVGRQAAIGIRGDAIPAPTSVAYDALLDLTIGLI